MKTPENASLTLPTRGTIPDRSVPQVDLARVSVIHIQRAQVSPLASDQSGRPVGDLLFVGGARCNLQSGTILEHMGTYVRPSSPAGLHELNRIATGSAEDVNLLGSAAEALLSVADFVGDSLLVSTTDARQTSALLRNDASDLGLRFCRRMWLDLPGLSAKLFLHRLSVLRMAAVFGFLPSRWAPHQMRVTADQHLRLATHAMIRLCEVLSPTVSPLKNLYLGGFPAHRQRWDQ